MWTATQALTAHDQPCTVCLTSMSSLVPISKQQPISGYRCGEVSTHHKLLAPLIQAQPSRATPRTASTVCQAHLRLHASAGSQPMVTKSGGQANARLRGEFLQRRRPWKRQSECKWSAKAKHKDPQVSHRDCVSARGQDGPHTQRHTRRASTYRACSFASLS